MEGSTTINDGEGIGIGEMEFMYSFWNTYEIWILSILSAFLVGLSGIFPLLIIPMESGPALKHGGE